MQSSLSMPSEESERNHRALTVLYAISIASRGQTELRQLFETITAELAKLFSYDACYIAICDSNKEGKFRATLLIDQDIVEYEEDTEYGTLTRLLIQQQTPLLFRDLPSEGNHINRVSGMFGDTQKSSRSWLGVPLLIGSQTIGVISIQSYTPALYTNADAHLLQQIGNLAGVLIENANLVKSQQELSTALAEQVGLRSRELEALGQVASEMVRRQPLRDLLDHVTRLAATLFMVDAAIIRLLDPQQGDLQIVSQYGVRVTEGSPGLTMRIPIVDTFTGQAIIENRPIFVSGKDARALEQRGLSYKSLLTVPLRVGELIIGGLTLLYAENSSYDPQRIQAVMALANQIAITIENARLFAERDRRVHELSAMSSIAQATSTAVEQATVLWRVYLALSNFLPIDSFSMIVYDPERKIVTNGLSIDEGREHCYLQRQPLPSDSLTAWVLNKCTTLRFSNLEEEILAFPELSDKHLVGSLRISASWLGAPMIGPTGKPIGVISVQSYSKATFSQHDEQFLVSVASQVALIVQNVILFERNARRIRELDAIERISRSISSAFSLDKMFQPIYEVLEQVTEATSFFIIICDPDTQAITHQFYIDAGEHIVNQQLNNIAPKGSLSSWILDHSLPLLFDDIEIQRSTLEELGIQPYRYGSDRTPHSWAGVPLFNADARAIGVIAIQDTRPYQYDQQTIEFLYQVASHLSLGVQKVALFAAEKTARRTADTLREVARVLNTSLDPDDLLELILGELQHVVSYDTASIMLLEEHGLRIVAVRGWRGQENPRGMLFPMTEVSSALKVAASKQVLIINDTHNSSSWHTSEVGAYICAWLGAPLIVKGQVLGVLNVDSVKLNHFNANDAEVVQAFANHAAVAIENARLYADSKTRVEQELLIARQIQRNLFPHSLPKIPRLNIAARCIPANETGGDFYDCFIMPGGGNLLAVLIGDASGKSIPAALLMAVARSIARSEARDHIFPEETMRETNNLMVQDVPHGSFVAMSYAIIDVKAQKMLLSSAGQLTPLRCDKHGRLSYLEVQGTTLPLGIREDVDYKALEVALKPGDTLVLYTDGLVEAQKTSRELFGFERFEKLIQKYRHLQPEQLIDQIIHEISLYTSPAQPHDDMTIVVVQLED